MKKIHIIPAILFGLMLIGADDCSPSSCKTESEPPPCSEVSLGPSGAGGDGAGGSGDPGDVEPQSCTDGSELGTYIRCRGLGPSACAAQCNAIGAYCVEFATHPEKPSIGIGPLKQCMEGMATYTCTYCYDNGDVCSFICALKGCGFGKCTNTGGKGCE